MPSISRRRLLATGTAVAGGYAGYRLFEGTADAAFETWTPDRGTWPLPRYDPANTGHNPRASPPREKPSRRTLVSVGSSETGVHPLVGSSRLVHFGPGLSTAPRNGSGWTSVADARIRHAGLGPDGRLHAVERTDTGRFEVAGYDGTAEAYRIPVGGGFPEWLTIGATEIYVGLPDQTVVSIDSGGRDWRVDGAKTALADGRLYPVGPPGGVAAYAERAGFDRVVTHGPKRVWAGRLPPGEVHAPAVADGRLVVGTRGDRFDTGAVVAFDAKTGEQLWNPRTLGESVVTPALKGGRGFAAVFGDGAESGNVVALDLASGEVVWSDDTTWYAFDPVVGGDTLVVLGQVRRDGEPTAGKVRAYDTASGEVLWTETFEDTVPWSPGVALVDDRVLVGSGETLYELS